MTSSKTVSSKIFNLVGFSDLVIFLSI